MEHGVTDEELARISAPVGLDLGATGARETALSIMAECVAVRYGRDGGRLCQKGADRKRIHAEAASAEHRAVQVRAAPVPRAREAWPPAGLLRGSGAGGPAGLPT